MNSRIIELPNGLRIIYQYVSWTRAVHCGYIINSGSRDDLQGEMGMAHFIEHMIFKGTVKRKTFHILNYLESVGGDLNAYTTREKTCLYASMVAEHFDRAIELLTDIAFNSTFPEKEIVKEKQVIAEEIDMYRNVPDEAIFEDFDEMVFPDHSLGHPILGTKSSINGFTRYLVKERINRSFTRDQIVLSIVGNVSEKEVNRIIQKYLAHLELPEGSHQRQKPEKKLLENKIVPIEQEQAHEIIGGRSYPLRKELYVPFLLLNNILGGPGMNSRLNLNIREKFGLTYSIHSFYTPYVDSGIWGVYYACESRNIKRIRRLILKELKFFQEKSLGSMSLNQAKKQLSGQLILSHENLLTQMLAMAADLLDFGKLTPFSSYIESIESITSSQIQEAARQIFGEQELTMITYKEVG